MKIARRLIASEPRKPAEKSKRNPYDTNKCAETAVKKRPDPVPNTLAGDKPDYKEQEAYGYNHFEQTSTKLRKRLAEEDP